MTWLLVWAIFAFAPDTHRAWHTLCDGRPYRNGAPIEAEQMDALTELRLLGVPGFWNGDPLPIPSQIDDSCENFEAFLRS